MEKAEEQRQALLKTMSRTQRRKERVANFPDEAAIPPNRSRHRKWNGNPSLPGNSGALGGRGPECSWTGHPTSTSTGYYLSGGGSFDADATASLVDDGVLFRPGPTSVKLRTAKQMQAEVARRRRCPAQDDQEQQQPDSSLSTAGAGNGGGNVLLVGRRGRGQGGGGGGGGGGVGGQGSLSSLSTGSLTVRRKGNDSANNASTERVGVVLEVNRTGGAGIKGRGGVGGRSGRGGGGGGRCGLTGGRPNMIFTPSLVPLGMESVRACPMSLGDASRASSARCVGDTGGGFGGSSTGEGGGVEIEDGGDESGGEGEAVRDTRTV